MATLAVPAAAVDDDSQAWVAALAAGGQEQEDAAARLHALLLKAARFEVGRRRPELWAQPGEIDEIASQAASDALVSIMAKLGDYRGESRFTTWAYKFALLEASVKVRRRRWVGREVALDDATQGQLLAREFDSARAVESSELLHAIATAMDNELTPHQRRILVAVVLEGVPIDVLAERLGTTRGAIYKTVHDARRKLRAELGRRGFEVADD